MFYADHRRHEEQRTTREYFPKTNINIRTQVGRLVAVTGKFSQQGKDEPRGLDLFIVLMLPTWIATHRESKRKISSVLVAPPLHLLPSFLGSFIFYPQLQPLTASFVVTAGKGKLLSPCRVDFHSRAFSFVAFSPSYAPLFIPCLPANSALRAATSV